MYRLLNNELHRELLGIGCAAHIVHNCLQTAVDVLPIDVEVLAVKIYKYFHIYTVRVTELKSFCDFVDIEYNKLLQHGNTRFLSLLPALERILEIFQGLKSYFCSQEQCPTVIKKFFENECGEMYLQFVCGQLRLFNQAILRMEKTNITATEVACELQNLKQSLSDRKENQFIPERAKIIFRELEENGSIDVPVFKKEILAFYSRCIEYIELWEGNFREVESFSWINQNEIKWPEVEKTAQLVNTKVGQSQCKINIDELFDEVSYVRRFVSQQAVNSKPGICLLEEKWIGIFKHFNEQNIPVHNFLKVAQFVFSLPGTSAPVERVFSIMKNMWSPDRNRMDENTVRALLYCKINFNLTCKEFYEKIKTNTSALRQVHSSEKYTWFCKKNDATSKNTKAGGDD